MKFSCSLNTIFWRLLANNFAKFSNVEVLVDPYSYFASGEFGIRALASFDIRIRQPSAFAAIVDAVA